MNARLQRKLYIHFGNVSIRAKLPKLLRWLHATPRGWFRPKVCSVRQLWSPSQPGTHGAFSTIAFIEVKEARIFKVTGGVGGAHAWLHLQESRRDGSSSTAEKMCRFKTLYRMLVDLIKTHYGRPLVPGRLSQITSRISEGIGMS